MIYKNAPEKLMKSLQVYVEHSIVANIEDIIVAGGFIRAYFAGEKPSDLDLYFKDNTDLLKTKSELETFGWVEVFKTDRAVTVKKNENLIQLISYLYGEPEEIINLFDFTICCASMTITRHEIQDVGEDDTRIELHGHLILHDDFFENLSGRTLEFIGTPLPLSSLQRAFKFVKRGYSICDENIVKIAESIFRQVDFDDEGKLTEHLAGIDQNGKGIRVID